MSIQQTALAILQARVLTESCLGQKRLIQSTIVDLYQGIYQYFMHNILLGLPRSTSATDSSSSLPCDLIFSSFSVSLFWPKLDESASVGCLNVPQIMMHQRLLYATLWLVVYVFCWQIAQWSTLLASWLCKNSFAAWNLKICIHKTFCLLGYTCRLHADHCILSLITTSHVHNICL